MTNVIRTLETRDLETDRSNLEDELTDLIGNIPCETDDGDYMPAVEALADWLGLGDTDQIEFFGNQPWLDGEDECLRYAAAGTDGARLRELNNMRDEISDWRSGTTLINEDDFPDYAEEYANDSSSENLSHWPYNHIDWSAAAEELAADFSRAEYDGDTYLYRS